MGLDDILIWVAGIITASGGVYIAIHEVRRRERKVTRQEIDDLTDEVQKLITQQSSYRSLLLEQRRYIYKLVVMMIDAGMNPPQPPDPSFDPGEYDNDKDDS